MTDLAFARLEREIARCELCPRLRAHCRDVASRKRRAYRDDTYWGRPVPGFGDRDARVLFVGLAPAAHGANRTGRMFTGDRSGEWLYGALHRAGFASRARSVSRDDGLVLHAAFLSAVCRCAPPANRPLPEEIERCAPFLARELAGLRKMGVVVALGGIAWHALLRHASPGSLPRPRPRFAHGAEVALRFRDGGERIPLLGCYHPSQQNTQTGRLTRPMLDAVIGRARALAASRD